MAVVVIRDPVSGKSFTAASGSRMYIYAESTGTISFSTNYAPKEIEYGGWAQTWAQLARSGNTPLLLRQDQPLETLKFSTLVASPDPLKDLSNQLSAIKALARTKERVLVRYSGLEAGQWRITELTAQSMQRHPDTNAVTQALLTMTLTQASDAAPAVGPVTRPAPPPPPPPAPSRRHTVVPGDCLWNIALAYYGSGVSWPKIFDANRGLIADPHWIFPGQVFVIP